MKKLILSCVFILCLQIISAQTPDFNQFLYEVLDNPNTAQISAEKFMKTLKIKGTPLICGEQCIFIYEFDNLESNPNPKIAAAGDFNNWNPAEGKMLNVPNTNLFYKIYNFPTDARLDYKFVVNENWILDPYNKNRMMSGFGPNSELKMNDYYESSSFIKNEKAPKGIIKEFQINSEYLKEIRKYKVYTPPFYNKSKEYPAVYFHDGYEFLEIAEINTILDNLINSKRIEPLIAVFIPPNERMKEYFTDQKDYTDFIIKELIPAADSDFSTDVRPENRCTAGISAGGTYSIYLGYNYPHIFGKIISQSGVPYSREGKNQHIVNFMNAPKKDLEIYIDTGLFEEDYFLEYNRFFRYVLNKKGYRFMYKEFSEGHSWGNWRNHIHYGLEFLFH